MERKKVNIFNKAEYIFLFCIYALLFTNAYLTNDSYIALISAFCGITYTILAGKGFPICYVFGVIGSSFYCYLAFKNAFWGNLLLYGAYYIPMQILGFFQWNKNLKTEKKEIVKTQLSKKEQIKLILITFCVTLLVISIIYSAGGKSPIIDGITTTFSIAGMYLTVKRCIEQWIVWIVVNGLSFVMWLNISLSGEKVLSTVIMWGVYFILAIYFYSSWKKEISTLK